MPQAFISFIFLIGKYKNEWGEETLWQLTWFWIWHEGDNWLGQVRLGLFQSGSVCADSWDTNILCVEFLFVSFLSFWRVLGALNVFSWQWTAERWQEITLSEDLAVDGGLLNPLATSRPSVCGVNQLSPFSPIKIFQTCLILLIGIRTVRHHEKQNCTCKLKRYLQCAVGSLDFLIHFRF